MPKSAIILGASSGIGLELAKVLSEKGYRLGIAARRLELLKAHATGDPNVVSVRAMDLSRADASGIFAEMAEEIGVVDLVVISSGTGHLNPELQWELEEETIALNAMGFARIACVAMSIFEKQGHGHLVGISSVAALRGAGEAPAYGATKAFASRYLQGLHLRAGKWSGKIRVTDVRPGFVDTPMMKADKPFWVASPRKAAEQIVSAIEAGKRIVYVTKRWSLIGWLLRHLPE
ncbi:SDR family NAD(P)-dependent oxidoreductase [Luteolibacter luteus]|uniref:SDR family NAD(P)-dependent oxidoreductase n=1 Tax=Luteolibacter luteus TaxID=2728835 RepID=A0A858RCQ8_9BACT|nr:SDR family NAD(P)-dependent oxidoreductase [Luteolibacter luteus]QJE94512.1 SDR family NAD(P)-dependent oxidoreductase [Luteolibacter luteus]